MQRFGLAVFLAAGVVSAAAQTVVQDNRPDVTVLKKQWRFEVRNPVMDEDPLDAAQAHGDRERRYYASMASNPDTPTVVSDVEISRDGGRVTTAKYIYEITVKNVGMRPIRMMILDYVFCDPATGEMLGRVSFTSYSRIGPGKTAKVAFETLRPPTGTIDARTAGDRPKPAFLESVEIRRIEYAT